MVFPLKPPFSYGLWRHESPPRPRGRGRGAPRGAAALDQPRGAVDAPLATLPAGRGAKLLGALESLGDDMDKTRKKRVEI